MSQLAAGVIGVGSMGANHARVYAELPDARLIGVADADQNRARAVADRHDTRVATADEVLADADVVSIAVPTDHHAAVARAAVAQGVHALVEKPFVRDPEQGRTLAEAADDAGVVLRVGHVERFNPAVETTREILGDAPVVSVRADRLGPPVDRAGSDGVVMDLMIHDIDVLTRLSNGSVQTIDAAATAQEAYCTAQLTFDTGTVATLTASRVTQKRTRRLAVATPDRLIETDYMDQSVRVHYGADGSYESDDGGVRYRTERVTEHPFVDSGEPLVRELRAFLDAVRGDGPGQVTPADGIRAVETARAIRRDGGQP